MKKVKQNDIKLKTIERTPVAFQCAACACPSVFETDRGTYILVGKKLNLKEISQEIKNKIGDGELGVEVPKELITKLFS